MSFARLAKKPEVLKEIADYFGTEVDAAAKAPVIIKQLESDGVTWEMAMDSGVAGLAEVDAQLRKEEEERRANAPKQLVRMTRENARFDVRGVTFTRENPFAIVNNEDAEFIYSHLEGFRPATPKEAQEFYV